VLSARTEAGAVVVRTQPNDYVPEIRGGGPGRPVPSDIIVEQRISAIPDQPFAFHIEYRIVHLGDDRHTWSPLQEFPAVYVNRQFDRFVHYSGGRPWTGEEPTSSPLPRLFTRDVRRMETTEWWGAFVNRAGRGLTIFTPGSYPYMVPGQLPGTGGTHGGGTSYLYSFTPFGIEPRQEIVGDVYLILGDYRAARRSIYRLQERLHVRDISAPVGGIDPPAGTLAGMVRIDGWTYDNVGVSRIELFVGTRPLGPVTVGQLRPDVKATWPGAPLNSGFTYLLDTTTLANGHHVLLLRMTDASGNSADRVAVVQVENAR
jgi:hypothetical protein